MGGPKVETILIIFCLMPISIGVFINGFLIGNYGRLRNVLLQWKIAHGGIDYKPKI